MDLGLGQVIFINDIEYVVRGMIAFREDSWEWKEYKLVANSGWCQWLSIEMEDGRPIYSLYRERYDIPQNTGIQIVVDGETYEMEEKGKATVTDYFGQVDVDRWEICKYTEYANTEKNKFVSYEDWDGELEKSTGILLRDEQVRITDEKRPVSIAGYSGLNFGDRPSGRNSRSSSMSEKIVVAVVLMALIVPIFSGTLTAAVSWNNNPVQSYLEKSSYFTYVTSVTNPENNKKAKVYKTDLTIEEAVKKIIDKMPGQIESVSEVSKEEGEEGDESVGLSTSKEYVFVYLSEEGTTYVQVSNRKYVTSSSNAYRSRFRGRRYYRTYSMGSYGNTNSAYTNYLNSARQSSVNSRRSSGGGTSYGK